MKGTELQFLGEIPLFVELSSDELQHLETLFEEKRYKRNAILSFEEDTGKLHVRRQDGARESIPGPSQRQENDHHFP